MKFQFPNAFYSHKVSHCIISRDLATDYFELYNYLRKISQHKQSMKKIMEKGMKNSHNIRGDVRALLYARESVNRGSNDTRNATCVRVTSSFAITSLNYGPAANWALGPGIIRPVEAYKGSKYFTHSRCVSQSLRLIITSTLSPSHPAWYINAMAMAHAEQSLRREKKEGRNGERTCADSAKGKLL